MRVAFEHFVCQRFHETQTISHTCGCRPHTFVSTLKWPMKWQWARTSVVDLTTSSTIARNYFAFINYADGCIHAPGTTDVRNRNLCFIFDKIYMHKKSSYVMRQHWKLHFAHTHTHKENTATAYMNIGWYMKKWRKPIQSVWNSSKPKTKKTQCLKWVPSEKSVFAYMYTYCYIGEIGSL